MEPGTWCKLRLRHQDCQCRVNPDLTVEIKGIDVFSREPVHLTGIRLPEFVAFIGTNSPIQSTMPTTPAATREWLISGVGDESWNQTVGRRIRQ
jgi:hypothetical protein